MCCASLKNATCCASAHTNCSLAVVSAQQRHPHGGGFELTRYTEPANRLRVWSLTNLNIDCRRTWGSRRGRATPGFADTSGPRARGQCMSTKRVSLAPSALNVTCSAASLRAFGRSDAAADAAPLAAARACCMPRESSVRMGYQFTKIPADAVFDETLASWARPWDTAPGGKSTPLLPLSAVQLRAARATTLSAQRCGLLESWRAPLRGRLKRATAQGAQCRAPKVWSETPSCASSRFSGDWRTLAIVFSRVRLASFSAGNGSTPSIEAIAAFARARRATRGSRRSRWLAANGPSVGAFRSSALPCI